MISQMVALSRQVRCSIKMNGLAQNLWTPARVLQSFWRLYSFQKDDSLPSMRVIALLPDDQEFRQHPAAGQILGAGDARHAHPQTIFRDLLDRNDLAGLQPADNI